MEAAALNQDGKGRKIVVTGCLAQRYGQQLAADLPEADLVGLQGKGEGEPGATAVLLHWA